MSSDAELATRNAALEAALQSHANQGKAQRCDCSLCYQLRDALADGAGRRYADLLREECALVAEEVYQRARTSEAQETGPALRPSKVAREIADRIRMLKGPGF